MKKILLLLLLAITIDSYAQITFENTYPVSTPPHVLKVIKLSSSGYKYYLPDTGLSLSTFTLYNLNHTVYKTISIPPLGVGAITGYNIYYISEETFNTNPSDVEYFISFSTSTLSYCRIFDEFGTVLFSKDTATVGNIYSGSATGETFIAYTPIGLKMMLRNTVNTKSSVYSLPGTLICNDCVSGTVAGIGTQGGDVKANISNYPNPTSGQTTIEYTLPQGITSADLVIYSITGQEIKRYKVTNAFNDIIIGTEELDAGTYYYQIQAANGYSAGKKMVVIKK